MTVCQIAFIVLVSKGSALNCPSTERMKEVRGALYYNTDRDSIRKILSRVVFDLLLTCVPQIRLCLLYLDTMPDIFLTPIPFDGYKKECIVHPPRETEIKVL